MMLMPMKLKTWTLGRDNEDSLARDLDAADAPRQLGNIENNVKFLLR